MLRRCPTLALALVALASAGVAQDRGPRRRGADEALKMVDAYVIANLQESLELTDEQFVALLPVIKSQQSQRREFAQQRQRRLQELRLAVHSGASDEQLEAALGRLAEVDARTWQSRQAGYAALDAELMPVQRAKFRIFEFEVERRIRELMRRVQQGQRDRPQSRDQREPPGQR